MAGSDNLNLALKITADAKQAQAQLQATQAELKGVSDAAVQANAAQVKSTQDVVAAQNAAMNAYHNARAPLAELNALLAQKALTSADVAKAEAILDQAQAKGIITTGELAAAFQALDAAKIKDIAVTEAQSTANTAAALNSRATSEIATAASEVLSGNFGRLRRTGAAFANQAGLITALMSPMGLALLAAGAGVVALAVAFVKGEQESEAYNRALISTGAAATATAGQLVDTANRGGAATGRYGDATQALTALANTGQYTRTQLDALTQTAVEFATMTGGKVADGVKFVDGVMSGNIDTLMRLDEQYHFLTASQYAEIQQLQAQGNEEQATAIAQKAASDAVHQRALEVQESAGIMVQAWDAVKNAAAGAWNWMKGLGAAQSISEQLKDTMKELQQAQSPQYVGAGNYLPVDEARVAALQTKINDLRHQLVTQGFEQTQAAVDQYAETKSKQGLAALAKFKTPLEAFKDATAQAKKDLDDAMLGNLTADEIARAKAHYQQALDAAQKAYDSATKQHGRKGPDLDKLQGNADVAAVQDSLAIITNAYKNADAQLAALRKNDQISDQQYYDGLRTDLDKYVTDRTAALEKEKAEVLAHATTQAQRIQASQKAAQIDAEITKTQQDAATKRMQIDADEKAAVEKTAQAWLDLQASLGLPVDVNTAKAMKKLQDLYDLLQKLKDEGKSPSDAQVDSMVGAALTTGVEKSPRLRSLRNIPGENNRDNPLALVDQDRQNENAAYAKQQAQLSANYAAAQKQYKGDNDKLLQLQQQYQKESEMYANQHKDAMVQITQAEYWGRLQVASDLLGQLSTLANSQNKKVAAVGKAAAIAQAMINTYASAVAAYKAGVSVGGPAAPAIGAAYAAVAIAAGLANVAQIRAQGTGGGYQAGGWTGNAPVTQVVGVVHGREGVLSAPEVEAIGGEAGFNRLRKAIRGYADGGYVSPFDSAPSPADLGFNVPSMPRVQMQAAGAREAATRQQSIKVVAVWDREQAAHEVMKSGTAEKAIVVTVGNNPRAIQGKWAS